MCWHPNCVCETRGWLIVRGPHRAVLKFMMNQINVSPCHQRWDQIKNIKTLREESAQLVKCRKKWWIWWRSGIEPTNAFSRHRRSTAAAAATTWMLSPPPRCHRLAMITIKPAIITLCWSSKTSINTLAIWISPAVATAVSMQTASPLIADWSTAYIWTWATSPSARMLPTCRTRTSCPTATSGRSSSSSFPSSRCSETCLWYSVCTGSEHCRAPQTISSSALRWPIFSSPSWLCPSPSTFW